MFFIWSVFFYRVNNYLNQRFAADSALHITSTWWQCAPNIFSSAFVLGITKTHNLCFQESEALQAVFASHLSSNVLKAPARLAAQYSVINLNDIYGIQQIQLQECFII